MIRSTQEARDQSRTVHCCQPQTVNDAWCTAN